MTLHKGTPTNCIENLIDMKKILVFLILLNSVFANTQTLDYETRVTVGLEDGTSIELYGTAKNRSQLSNGRYPYYGDFQTLPTRNNEYYYLPPSGSVRLSKNSDGVPEFSLLKFTTDEKKGPQGGLLHFLVEWGLTPAQEQELQVKLRTKLNNPKAIVKGAVPVQPMYQEESGSFKIISGTLSDEGDDGFTKSIISGSAPTVQGGKTAVAARLDRYGATLLENTFTSNSSTSDVSIEFSYTYPIQVQAALGNITFDQRRYQFVKDSLYKKYTYEKKGGFLWWGGKKKRDYKETREVYEELINTNVLKCEFIEGANIPEEKIKVVRDAFFNLFLNQFTTPTSELPKSTLDKLKNPGDDKNVFREDRRRTEYVLNVDIEKESNVRSSDRLSLDWRISVDFPLKISGNLKSWYDEIINNPQCISTVNISDPFYDRAEIRVGIDVYTKDIFTKNVNAATAIIQFGNREKKVTFDSQTGDSEFVQKVLFGDQGSGNETGKQYRYKTAWNYGGQAEIDESPWFTSDEPYIALVPTIEPRTLTLAGRQEVLVAQKIINVTAEIRYRKFGKEYQAEIDFFGSKEPTYQAKKVIFVDKSSRAYAYRLIYHHEELGDLATNWKEKNTNFILAMVPENINELEEPEINEWKRRINNFREFNGLLKEILNEFGELKKIFKGD